ncbi:MAG: hypothetical protein CL867_04145 [Cytophagaceae bacterium]|nr:hypothetical protein [Cytophagaceae bacterium]
MTIKSFIQECHRREVFKKLSLYVVFSWIVIQVLAATWDPLGFPKQSVTVLILILLIGLPLYAFYIGKFEVKELEVASMEDGIETEEERSTIRLFKKYFYLGVSGITALVAVGVFFIVNNTLGATKKQLLVHVSDKIAVLKFDNNTGMEKYDVVSEMAADWIIQGITENKLGQVVSPGIIDSYRGTIDQLMGAEENKAILKDVIKPKTIISGNFYLQANQLLFKGSVFDGKTDEILISFNPIKCDESDPLVCVENLQQIVLGYIDTKDKEALNLQSKPPKYAAYQSVLMAKEAFNNDNQEYLRLLNTAIAEDPEYFEPKVLKIAHFYNLGDYTTADSLLNGITLSRNNNRQRNLLKMYAALLQGENGQVYRYIQEEYNLAPFDLMSNSSTMVIAQQFVNRPQDLDTIFKAIPMEKMDIANCGPCQSRILMKAQSLVARKQYRDVMELPYDKKYFEMPYLIALIRLGDEKAVTDYMDLKEVIASAEALEQLRLFVAKQHLIVDSPKAKDYLKAVQSSGLQLLQQLEATYWLKDYAKAKQQATMALTLYPERISVVSQMAMIAAQLNDKGLENRMLLRLEALRRPYQFGAVDYAMAQYYASTAQEEQMYNALTKAAASGIFYTLQKFQYDPHFKAYYQSEPFIKLLSFWKKV